MRTMYLWLGACLLAAAAAAHAGIVEADDEINARIARIKIDRTGNKNPNEKLVDARKGNSEADVLGDGCNIALGNIFQPQSGIGTSARQQTTVVVQGDVILANNRCSK